MNEDRERLLRFLECDLSESEAQTLWEFPEHEPDLLAQIDRLRALRRTLATSKPDSFAPYFSERVLRRLAHALKTNAAESFYDSLHWVFVRAALASLMLAVILSTYNVLDFQGLGVTVSLVEALFGLPSATLADALSYGTV